MLVDALHPQGGQPRELPAPQDQPYVLRRLRETLQETQRGGRRLWDITPSPGQQTQTPPPHPPRVDARTTAAPAPPRPAAPREPRAPHNIARLTPRPAALPPNPRGVTPWAAPGQHAGDAPCRHSSAARAPGREPIPPACRRSPRTTATRTRPGRARPHPGQTTGQRQRPGPPADPPGSELSPTTHPASPPAVTHRYPLHSEPPPPNIKLNPAQKKPRDAGADGHRRVR